MKADNQRTKYTIIATAAAFLLFMIYASSCTKPKAQTYLYTNAAFKQYFSYQPGTYWVFYDSLNNVEDSFKVMGCHDQMPSPVETAELTQVSVCRFIPGDTLPVELWDVFIGPPAYCSLNMGGSYRYTLADSMPFSTTSSFDKIDGITKSVNMLTTTTIGNIACSNVYRVVFSFTTPSQADTFYFDSTHGLLSILFHEKTSQRRLFLSRGAVVR